MIMSRKTKAKTKIHELILASSIALSHIEIQNDLKGFCDRVTIYRVLERLLDEGLIHKILNIDGVVKYDSCHSCSSGNGHKHIHFSCQKCKLVTWLEDVNPKYKLPKSYKVNEMNFTLSGLCPKCS